METIKEANTLMNSYNVAIQNALRSSGLDYILCPPPHGCGAYGLSKDWTTYVGSVRDSFEIFVDDKHIKKVFVFFYTAWRALYLDEKTVVSSETLDKISIVLSTLVDNEPVELIPSYTEVKTFDSLQETDPSTVAALIVDTLKNIK